MPESALLTHTVEAVLLELAGSASTGCLIVRDPDGDEAEVYLRQGKIYAVTVPGRRVMLGVRLMSRGALSAERLAEALEIQRTELSGWRLGELLVHLGFVEQAVVEEYVVEHLTDALVDLVGWPVAAWKFRKNKKTRQDVAPPRTVATLFEDLRHRATTWERIVAMTGGPEAVPILASASPVDDVALGPNEWALLAHVDGIRPLGDVAAECGFTLFEGGLVALRLLESGLIALPASQPRRAGRRAAPESGIVDIESQDWPGVELVLPVVSLTAVENRKAGERADLAEREAAAEQAHDVRENKRLREAELLHIEMEALASKEAAIRAERAVARKQARAEEVAALAAAEAEEAAALAAAEAEVVAEQERQRRSEHDTHRRLAEDSAWDEHARLLSAERTRVEPSAWAEHELWLAAEEAVQLAAEQATARAAHAARLAAERAIAQAEAYAEHEARLAAERAAERAAELAAAEESAWAEHLGWLAAQRALVESRAWLEHGVWLEARRRGDEGAAWADHARWLDAERASVEAAAWQDHEHWLAAQRAALRARDEDQAWDEHARWLAARAAEESAHTESQRRAARVAAEKALAAEAARRARAAAQAKADTDRMAAESAEEIARAEATRVLAEQHAAGELAERAEADRVVAQEAARAKAAALADEKQLAEKQLAEKQLAEKQPAEKQLAEKLVERVAGDEAAARREAEDAAAVQAAQAAQAAHLLTELNRLAPVAEAVPEKPQAPPPVVRDHADTAMLMRALSSLGGDDDAPVPAAVASAKELARQPARAAAPVDKKKRKGLFGRG